VEVIQTGLNGILAGSVSREALREALQFFIEGRYHFSNKAIRDDTITRFEQSIQALKYIDLYKTLL